MMTNESAVYVLDTHALYWYWADPGQLGRGAEAAFGELERRQALGLVPLIVVAELHYLTGKLRRMLSVEEILRLVDRSSSLRLEALTRRHILAFGQLGEIPEMHDRFIGAVALVHNAPVISRDSVLRDRSRIEVIW